MNYNLKTYKKNHKNMYTLLAQNKNIKHSIITKTVHFAAAVVVDYFHKIN